MSTSITELLVRLKDGSSLTEEQMASAMKEIMSGRMAEEGIISFLTHLRDKGESPEEILGAVRVLREFSMKINFGDESIIDTCGTGGDSRGTFNISTAASFVVAGGNVLVAKHGNRAVSSKTGSADLLEAAGVQIDMEPAQLERCLKKTGFAFLFAPKFHPAMKHVAAARKKIGTRTIFNLLGPLINPANPKRQVIGVFDRSRMILLAETLKSMGSIRVLLVHGEDGLDEITLTGKTFAVSLQEGKITEEEINPQELGLTLCRPTDLQGGDILDNSHLLRGLLQGYECPLRDAVMLNAAAAFVVAERAKNIEEGLLIAEHSLDQGKAYKVFKDVVKISEEQKKDA